MLREIVLDTETTGLDPDQGHRIVEVAALELVNHLPTGRTFHSYVNPQRDMPEEAFRVHGLSAPCSVRAALSTPNRRHSASRLLEVPGKRRCASSSVSIARPGANASSDCLVSSASRKRTSKAAL